jgi:hypothetical protein
MRDGFVLYGKNSDRLKELLKELNSDLDGYKFTDPIEGNLEALRAKARVAHGYKPDDASGDLLNANKYSPLNLLINQPNLNPSYNEIIIDNVGNIYSGYYIETKKVKINPLHTITPAAVKQAQDNVQIYYNPNKVTLKEALKIQQIKAGILKADSEKEEQDLKEKASYVVVRGEVYQHFGNDGKPLPSPVKRVLYYANFPNFHNKGRVFARFSPGGVLDDSKKSEVLELFRDVILLQAEVAAINVDFIDIVTPNAFFYSLNKDQQEKAKGWFAEAIVLAAGDINKESEGKYKNLKGLIVHDTAKGIEAEVEKIKVKFPLIVSKGGDASAAQRALFKLGRSTCAAESIMGEPLGAAGNGALGNRASQAKEENDTRKCVLWVQAVFGPQFNKNLLNKKYQEIGLSLAPTVPVLSPALPAALLAPVGHAEKIKNERAAGKVKMTCSYKGKDCTFKLTFSDTNARSSFINDYVKLLMTPENKHSDHTSSVQVPRPSRSDNNALYFEGFKGNIATGHTAIVFAEEDQLKAFIKYFDLPYNGEDAVLYTKNCLYFDDAKFKLGSDDGIELTAADKGKGKGK